MDYKELKRLLEEEGWDYDDLDEEDEEIIIQED